jgi:hypothetical protein
MFMLNSFQITLIRDGFKHFIDDRFIFAFKDDLFFAIRAEFAHQALSDSDVERTRDDFGIDPEVEEAGEGARCVIGVEGREDEVPGQGSVDRGRRRLAESRISPTMMTSGSWRSESFVSLPRRCTPSPHQFGSGRCLLGGTRSDSRL